MIVTNEINLPKKKNAIRNKMKELKQLKNKIIIIKQEKK